MNTFLGHHGSIGIRTNWYRSSMAGGRDDDITDLIGDATQSLNQDATTSPWTLKGDTVEPDVFSRYVDYVIPEMVLIGPDGEETPYQLGLHRIVQTPKKHPTSGTTGGFVTEDMAAVLGRFQLTSNYTVSASGSDVTSLIVGILLSVGFTAAQIAIPAITKMPSADTAYYPGDSWRTVINNTLQSVGYRNIYMDRSGRLTTSPQIDLRYETPVVTYDNGDVIGTVDEDHDDSRLRNFVAVRRITPGLPTITATASNTDPSSPLYIYGPVGMLAGLPIDDPAIADQATAQAIADAELSYGSSFYSKASIKTVPDPNLGLFDVVSLDIRDAANNVQLDGTWLRRTVELPLPVEVKKLARGMSCSLNRTTPFALGGA